MHTATSTALLSPHLFAYAVVMALLIGSAPAIANDAAQDATVIRTPEGTLIRSGAKLPQRSIDGILLDRRPTPDSLPLPVVRNDAGDRIYHAGPRSPFIVGHMGCPGCDRWYGEGSWMPWIITPWSPPLIRPHEKHHDKHHNKHYDKRRR